MKKKKKKPKILKGFVGTMHVHATFNNTIITISDTNGDTISWASAGTVNFKGSRKGTPFAAQKAAEQAVLKACEDYNIKKVNVIMKGSGPGREPCIRAVHQKGIRVLSIEDITAVPHNGCRPPKRRRI
uniref:30S ribosomal protein S11 n=1 Tax=Dictyotopsis propagulifera TaxID=670095 RepID=UPI002E762407|nr:30S ribosomal protein S11 [Dictyotopsis propagulifera]WAM63135.1 30S ribosomal protein S11 [Dictyotopsis propagulifera]